MQANQSLRWKDRLEGTFSYLADNFADEVSQYPL